MSWDLEDKEEIGKWLKEIEANNLVYYLLANDEKQKQEFARLGYSTLLVNQNCFIDYNLFTIRNNQIKKYDGVMNARLYPFKRHGLANEIKTNLALITYTTSEENKEYSDKVLKSLMPAFVNSDKLTSDEVVAILNQSKVGMILSEREGACYASTEYLFCGLPVLSTPSSGGRDLWYNENNSVICEPSAESVFECYKKMLDKDWDRELIRRQAIILADKHRAVFNKKVQEIFNVMGLSHLNAFGYFNSRFFNVFYEYLDVDRIKTEISKLN